GRHNVHREFYAALRGFPLGAVALRYRTGTVFGLGRVHLPSSKQRFLRLSQQSDRRYQDGSHACHDENIRFAHCYIPPRCCSEKQPNCRVWFKTAVHSRFVLRFDRRSIHGLVAENTFSFRGLQVPQTPRSSASSLKLPRTDERSTCKLKQPGFRRWLPVVRTLTYYPRLNAASKPPTPTLSALSLSTPTNTSSS